MANTFIQIPSNLQENIILRRFLEKLVEQLDIAFGNRGSVQFTTDTTTNTLVAQINISLATIESNIDTLQIEVAGKEPAFTKNTAFNKNFGVGNDDVARGDHLHPGDYTNNPEQPAIADLNQVISNNYQDGEVQAISDKVDEILAALRASDIISI